MKKVYVIFNMLSVSYYKSKTGLRWSGNIDNCKHFDTTDELWLTIEELKNDPITQIKYFQIKELWIILDK